MATLSNQFEFDFVQGKAAMATLSNQFEFDPVQLLEDCPNQGKEYSYELAHANKGVAARSLSKPKPEPLKDWGRGGVPWY